MTKLYKITKSYPVFAVRLETSVAEYSLHFLYHIYYLVF